MPSEDESGAALDAALVYVKRGWVVVPVEYRGKRPINPSDAHGRGWQDLRGNEDDIRAWFGGAPRNVGVLLGAPSGDVVDVDLDASEAIELAPAFLPRTGCVFGRPSKYSSHWLYVSPDARTRKYVDPVDGAMLVEIRASGAQTVFPPSVHESGESVEWTTEHGAAEVRYDALLKAVQKLAAAALLARHWPGPGARHDAQLTLIGFLTRLGWDVDNIAYFAAMAIGASGGDADVRKRRATALDAARRLRQGQSVRGLPKLAETFGAKVGRSLTQWLGDAPEDEGEGVDNAAPTLTLGSQVELASVVVERLRERYRAVVHCEGSFWRWSENHWREIVAADMRKVVHELDGAHYPARGVRTGRIRQTSGMINGVLCEAGALLEDAGFFETPAPGINCASGLLTFAPDGRVTAVSHEPDHSLRHVLPGAWCADLPETPAAGTLLLTYLERACGGGEEGRALGALLAEIAGVAALGAATQLKQPKAVILTGERSNNGKSAFLDMVRALVSPGACASIGPRRFADDKYLIRLIGKTLNAADELSGEAIASDVFKQVVTGEMVSARDVYAQAISFRPRALHLFACNELPSFKNGIDRGVQRRLLVVPMNVEIPEQDRIPNIGARIGREEADLLLAWAVGGARRVLAQGAFSSLACCETALKEWAMGADPVAAWLNDPDEVELLADAQVPAKQAYSAFRSWAESAGFTPAPNQSAFTLRVQSGSREAVSTVRRSNGRMLIGMRLRRQARAR